MAHRDHVIDEINSRLDELEESNTTNKIRRIANAIGNCSPKGNATISAPSSVVDTAFIFFGGGLVKGLMDKAMVARGCSAKSVQVQYRPTPQLNTAPPLNLPLSGGKRQDADPIPRVQRSRQCRLGGSRLTVGCCSNGKDQCSARGLQKQDPGNDGGRTRPRTIRESNVRSQTK